MPFDDLPDLSSFAVKKTNKASQKVSQYDALFEKHGRDNDVDPDLLRSMTITESTGDPNAQSFKGATGLMQLIPATAQRFGVTDITNPDQNIAGGTKYMKFLLDRYKGDVDRALVGYNAGEGKADREDWQTSSKKWSNSPTGKGSTSDDYRRIIRGRYQGGGYYHTALPDLSQFNQANLPDLSQFQAPDLSQFAVQDEQINDPYAAIGQTTKPNEPVTEKDETIEGQITSAADPKVKTRYGVYFPTSDQALAFANKLDQKEWGIFPDERNGGSFLIPYAKAKQLKLRTPQEIQEYIKKNPRALATIAGIAEDVGKDTSGKPAVMARDGQTGVELATAAVTTPETAEQQINIYQDQFPNAEIGVTTTEDVAKNREALQPVDTTKVDDLARQYGRGVPMQRPQRKVVQKPVQPKSVQPKTAQPTAPVSGKMPATPDLTEKDYQDYFTANPDLIDTPANRNAVQELYKAGKWNTEAQRQRLGESSEPVMLDDEPAMQRVSAKDADNAIADLINVEGLSIEDATKKVRSEMSAKYDKDFSTLVLTDTKGNPITDPAQLKKQIGLTYGKLKTYGVDTEPLVSQKVAETRIEDPEPDLSVKSDFSAEDAESLNNTFGTTIGSAIASTLNAGGNTANSLAGLLKIIQELNPAKLDSMAEAAKLEPYRAGDDVIKYLQGVGASTGALTAKTGDKYYEPATEADKGYLEGRPIEKETWATTGGKAFGALADMPRVALMPGGLAAPMLSFATDAMLQAASQGEKVDWGKVKQAGIHGAVLGGIAQAAPFIGKAGDTAISTLLNKASSNVLKEGITLGTIGGGTYVASREMGASPDAAFREAVLFSAMHGFGVLKKLKGEPIRVKDTNGNEAVIKVSENGKVETLDPKTEAKAQMVIPKEVETQIQAYLKKDAEIQAEAKQEVTNVVDNSVEITHKGKKVQVSPEVKSKLDDLLDNWNEQKRTLEARKAEERSLGEIKKSNATETELTQARNAFNKQRDALIADNKTPKGDVAVEPKVVDKPAENKVESLVESKVEPTDTGEVQVTQTRNGVTRTGVVIDHPTLGKRVQIIRPDGTKGGTTGLDESWKPIDPVAKAKQEALDTHITETVANTTLTPEKAAESILKTYESTNTPNTGVEPAKTSEVKTDSNVRSEGKTEPEIDAGSKGTESPNTGERGQGETSPQSSPRLNVPKEYGSSNTKFTRDKAENAKAVLLKKFGGEQTKMGSGLPDLDTETLGALKDLAGFHLEAGVKKLGELADKVAKEVGDWSRPHIESIYAGMKSKETSDSQGEVKVSRSIVQKAVDAKELPLDIAKYDKTTNKGRQAAMDDLVANHPEQLQRILDGKEKVPDTMLGAFIKAVEDHANKITDPQQARDIRRALIDKVTPETSVTAQELQGLGVREQDSLTVIANELKAARKEAQQIKGHDVKGMEKRIADLEKQLEDHKVGLAKEQTKADVAEAVTAERASRPFIDRAERYAEQLRTEADKARERLKKRGAVFTSGVDPVALKDLAQIGASHIADLGLDFAKFSDKMIGEFGDKIKPHLKDIYDKATDVAGKFERRAVKMIETRLEGQIDNLERQIETKTRDVVKREPIPLSEKGKALQAKRNELRKELDALVPKEQQTRTVAQKQEAYKKNLERQIDALNKQIETGVKPAKSKPLPTNPQIEALKEQREALKAKLPAVNKSISDAQYNTQRAKALQKQITDLDAQIKSGVKTEREIKARNVSPEVAKLIEKRDQLKSQHTEVFGKPEMSDAKRLQLWKKNADTRIAILKGEQDVPTKREPIELDAEGRKLQTQITLLKSKVDLTDAEIEKIADLTKAVADTRAKLEGNQRAPLGKPTDAEIAYATADVALSNYVNKLKIKAGRTSPQEFREADWKGKGKIMARGALKLAMEHPGFTKNILASLDASATALTGWRFAWAHPKLWAKNALKGQADLVKTFGNKPVADALKIDIQGRPNQINGTYKKMGLDVSAREEDFPMENPFGRLAQTIDKIPSKGNLDPRNIGKQALKVVPNAFMASENAFVGFQHRNRADLADLLLPRFEEKPRTEMDYKNLGRLINGLTGRGYLGKDVEKASAVVNLLMFAPRFLKSELDALGHIVTGGATIPEMAKAALGKEGGNKGTNFVRVEALKNLVKFVSGTATVLAMANAFKPGSVEFDPRSSDFGKIKIGNTRFDVSGHMASLVTLAARLATSESKSGKTGKITKLNEKDKDGKKKWGTMTTLNIFENYVEGKASPYGHLFLDWLEGEDFDGNPVDLTTYNSWDRAMENMHTPLPIKNVKELLNDPNAAPLWAGVIADYFGITTNTYGGSKHVQRLINEARERGDTKEVERLQPILIEEQKIEATKDAKRKAEVGTPVAQPQAMPMKKK